MRLAFRVLAAVAVIVAVVAAGLLVVQLVRDQRVVASAFTTSLDDDAPISDRSAEVVAKLAAQARYTPESQPVAGYYPDGYNTVIKEGDFSVPVYTVGPEQPTVPVVWVDENGQPHPPGTGADLQSTFDEVPMPTGVDQLQADGSDGHLVVHQPSTDTLWEFWTFRGVDDGNGGVRYEAGYGARIQEWSRTDGVLPHNWGARATSLDLLGGVMLMEDYMAGAFPYALTMAVPVIDDQVVPPASRSDGPFSGTPSQSMQHAVSEGMKFRLPADYDCGSPPVARPPLLTMICVAVRDYGLIVSDRSGGTTTLYVEDDRTVGTPYQEVEESPWPAIEEQFGGGAEAVLTKFPWEDLQLLDPVVLEGS